MFSKLAKFFIENSKLSLVLVIIILISGIGSYFVIPKQYNPTIIVPAFNVFVEANGLDNNETSKYITSKLENKIMEIDGIDEVYGLSGDNYSSVMVKFKVGEDLEDAKIKLNQKLSENMDLSPIGASNPVIKSINPEDLSQITFAIIYDGDSTDEGKNYIYLKQIASLISEEVKSIKNVSTIDIVGGFDNDLIVEIDLDLLRTTNTDLLGVYKILKENNINMTVGNIDNISENIQVSLSSRANTLEDIKKIVVSNYDNKIVYLEDISDIRFGVKKIDKVSLYNGKEAVFLGFGKSFGSNGVFLTSDVLEKVNNLKNYLPKDIKIEVIQNEGETANNATNMLLVNLFQSILIVFFVLALYLGKKDAFNTAVSIPLTLGLVFLIAYILGENINRITLFALILVLGMLVDNSTVVVENISRHLKERVFTGKTKLEATLDGVSEVGVGVILSTISRLLAFGAMFAVGGMMGEYMGAIPKFAIIALLVSLLIAFTINPWLSYSWANDISELDKEKKESKNSKYDIRKYYLDFMKYFLSNNNSSKKRIKYFKFSFWIILLLIIVLPIYIGVFKARMLPKSNQNQVYLWVDSPRGWSIEKMQEVQKDIGLFFSNQNSEIPDELRIVESLNSTIGQAFMGDFANLFRGGLSRVGENQISIRINLTPIKDNSRLLSENYVIKIRPYLRDYLLTKYPDLQLRLLEDPPGPPVRATFLMKIKSDSPLESRSIFLNDLKKEVEKISQKYSIVDIGDSISTTYRKVNIDIDNEKLTTSGLSSLQVSNTLAIALSGLDLNIVGLNESLNNTNLVLTVKSEQKDSIDFLKNITFTNQSGVKIYLSSISDINYSFVGNEINTDGRTDTDYIFAEMGNNSLVYPVLKLFSILKSDDFLKDKYKVEKVSPYKIEFLGLSDGKKYVMEWGGEWELTIDTFRDLGIAMIVSLLAIYFLLVGQFSSFKIAGIIMITFLLSFYGIFPGFTVLYLIKNEYFSATSMIGIIALGGIVVGNAIILIDYLNVLKKNGLTLIDALLKAGYVRFAPIILTSLTTVFGAATIVGDPVWSGLAWSIIWGLLLSSILTLVVIPIFYYDSQKNIWK